jgi:hypothetical protein
MASFASRFRASWQDARTINEKRDGQSRFKLSIEYAVCVGMVSSAGTAINTLCSLML